MKTWWVLGKEYSADDDMLISSLGTLPKLQHTMTNHVIKNGEKPSRRESRDRRVSTENGTYLPSVNA